MTLTTLDLFNLVASISSIILAVLAIVLSVVFYFASKNSEVKSTLAINKLERATDTINSLSMKLLNKLANYITSPNLIEQQLIEVVSGLRAATPLRGSEDLPKNPSIEQIDQFRVDNLIAAFYYAAIANSSLQVYLPGDIGQINTVSSITPLIDQSKQDYFTLKDWIIASGENRVNVSPVKHMYDQALELEAGIKNTTEVYASRQNQNL